MRVSIRSSRASRGWFDVTLLARSAAAGNDLLERNCPEIESRLNLGEKFVVGKTAKIIPGASKRQPVVAMD